MVDLRENAAGYPGSQDDEEHREVGQARATIEQPQQDGREEKELEVDGQEPGPVHAYGRREQVLHEQRIHPAPAHARLLVGRTGQRQGAVGQVGEQGDVDDGHHHQGGGDPPPAVEDVRPPLHLAHLLVQPQAAGVAHEEAAEGEERVKAEVAVADERVEETFAPPFREQAHSVASEENLAHEGVDQHHPGQAQDSDAVEAADLRVRRGGVEQPLDIPPQGEALSQPPQAAHFLPLRNRG